MAKKAAKPCECMEAVNKKLAGMGARLQTGFHIDFETGQTSTVGPYLCVERVGTGKKKLPTLICSYCPFCGKKK